MILAFSFALLAVAPASDDAAVTRAAVAAWSNVPTNEIRVVAERFPIDTIDAWRTTWTGSIDAVPPPQPAPPRPPLPPDLAPLRVGGDVKAPVIESRVEPLMPAEAAAANIHGIVILEIIVDRNGNVRDVQVLKPLPHGLDQAAVDAVKQWKYRPGTLNGVPVDVIYNITLEFK
jgi:TonB family protein